MHLPDGFLDGTTALATAGGSATVLTYAVHRTNRELGDRLVPLLGVTAGFVFAAQMVNFPVAGGTSGHLLGALLAAVLMGPWAAVVVMTAVLGLQAIAMADGGITAFGANVLNMGVVGGVVAYAVFAGTRRLLPDSRGGFLSAVALAAWLSVVLSAGAAALELAWSGTVPLGVGLRAMTSVHMIIGIGEAMITTTVVGAVLATRPDLIATLPAGLAAALEPGALEGDPEGLRAGGRGRARLGGFVAAALAVSLAVAVLLAPLASQEPDGLERVAEDEGFASAEKESVLNFTPFSDYEFPGIEGDLGVILVGVAGTLAVFAGALGLGRLLSRGHGQTATDEGATPGGGAEPGAGRGAGPAVGRVPGHGPGHGVLGHRHSGHEHASTQRDAG